MRDRKRYDNPLILQRADPWIYRHSDGLYYFTASVPEYDRIELRVAASIEKLRSAAPITVWRKPESGAMSCLIWAPEIHYLFGKWYLYFAASHTTKLHPVDGTFQHRMYVLEAEDPVRGPWVEKGQVHTGMDSFALDATAFEVRGKTYYVWAQKDREIRGNSNLYIAEMENAWTLKLPAVMLSRPEYDWECSVIPVNEGPAVLVREPWIYLTYSANATGPEYCMGMLKIRAGEDLLNPDCWEKSKEPVFTSCEENRKFGPGHSCFTKSEDGTEDILVYHVREKDKIEGEPLYDPDRHTCVQAIGWKEDGSIDFGAPEAAYRKPLPNIVMLVSDHQAYYGHPMVRRPHFEKLASDGAEFRRAYCSCPLCCPSRKSMLTGKFPHRHGQLENAVKTEVDSEETYYERLKDEGYALYYYGKWHASLGTPADLGCEGVSYPDYGNPYRQKEYREYIQRKGIPAARMTVEKNFWSDSLLAEMKEGDSYDFPGEMTNEALSGILTTGKESHEAFYLADMVCGKLEELAERRKEAAGDPKGAVQPFCLRVDFWGPHQPYHPTQEFADLYPPETIPEHPNFSDTLEGKPESYRFDTSAGISENWRLISPNRMPWEEWQKVLSRCYGQISLIDEAGGRILDKIRELGLEENTLILWTADHGDAIACHGGHFDKNCYLPEEVMRIPLAVKYPPVIPKGTVVEELVSNVDLAPTLLDAAGSSFESRVDGRSLLDLFRENVQPWRGILQAETNGHLTPWMGRMGVSQRYKYIFNKGDTDELYDLEQDPWEMKNLIEEDAYGAVVKELKLAMHIE